MKRQREAWVDAAKGIAIVFVVLGHVVASYQNVGLLTDAATFSYLHAFAYSFHMPLFFVLSGYVEAKHSGSGSKLRRMGHKVLSLGIPYLVFSVVTWGMKFFMSSLVNTPANLSDLLGIPLYPILYLWFLYALLLMSLIHILCEKWLGSGFGAVLGVAVAFGLRYLLLRTGFLGRAGLSGTVFESTLNYGIWYFAGVACAGFLKEWKTGPLWKMMTAVALAGYGVLVWANAQAKHYHDGRVLLMNAAGVALFICIAMCLKKSKLLAYLGKNSLSIYLLHEMVLAAVRILFTRLGVPLLGGVVPVFVVGTLGIAIPLLCYWVCCRIRILDFCFYPGKYLKKRNS